MTDPDTKRLKSKRRMRNFIAKKVLSEAQYRPKIHEDEKANEKRKKYIYEKEDYEDDSTS